MRSFIYVFLVSVVVSCASGRTLHVDLPAVEITELAPADTTDTAKNNRDPYLGSYTRVNDLLHTKLDLNFNWDSAFVYGQAMLTFKPYFYPTDSLTLDAKGFELEEVALINGTSKTPLKYDYNGQEIRIRLDRTYTRDDEYTLFVDYTAMPNKLKVKGSEAITEDKGLYFINHNGKDPDKPRQIWTQGETEANSCWFPTIDGPQENHTQEVSLTVQDELVTLSNGLMTASEKNGDGTRTDTWQQDQAHATYLTMIAIGDFQVTKDQWKDIEVNYYMEPEYAPHAKLIFGNTPEMLGFYSDLLGVEYPWKKYSQIVVRDFVSGAMENTSATVFFERMNMTDREYLDENHEDIIAHELFHHWFGDLVTCESWPNLPLNESFATYGEYLWLEHKYGRAEADVHGMRDLSYYLFDTDSHNKKLIRYDVADREDMFDVVSYQKGGRVLHMLRKYVGDQAFFESLKLYLNKHKYGTVEIHDLRLAFEEVTGKDLNWFFNQWFLAAGHPELSIRTSYDEAKKQVVIQMDQTQDTAKWPLYKLPVDVDIYSNGETMRKRITLNKRTQTFYIPHPRKPDLVNVDAEKMLPARIREEKPLQEWLFQYEHAPLYMDKYRALQQMLDQSRHEEVQQALLEALTDETTWAIRLGAINLVRLLSEENKEKARHILTDLAENDEKSLVRAMAVETLKNEFPKKDNKAIFEKALKDKSPSVEEAAQKALGK